MALVTERGDVLNTVPCHYNGSREIRSCGSNLVCTILMYSFR